MAGIASDFSGLGELATGIDSIIGKFVPDKTTALQMSTELKLAALNAQATVDNSQAATNTAEANSKNSFAVDWRPFIGWVCGAAFAWQFFFQPIFTYFVVLWTDKVPTLPVLDNSELTTVLLGMLGLGAMHVYENTKA